MLSFQQLQEKKTKIKINPKKEEMMEKSDVIDSGTSTEELYDSQEEVVEESSEESETQTTLLTFEERAARKMTLRNLQTLKKKTIPAAKAAEAKRKKEGKGEYSAAYKKKETDVTNYDDKAPAKKAAPKKKAVASVKKATPKAAPKKSEPKAKAKPAPKKEAPRTQKGAMAYDGPNKARSQAADRVKAKTKAKQKSLPKKKEAPKSKSVGDKARDWVKKGIKRHRKATQGARVFGKGFARGVKTAVKVAKDVKKVVSEGKTYSQFMKEMGSFNQSANQRGAFSVTGGFRFGRGTGQNKNISVNLGTGNSKTKLASWNASSTHTGRSPSTAVSQALAGIGNPQNDEFFKNWAAQEVAKERKLKGNISSTGGPNSYSSKIRKEEVELKTMNELFGLFKGRGQSGGNTGGGNVQRGGYNHAKTSARSANNPVLGFAKNLLGNKQNVAPAAKFVQAQQRKNDMLKLLNQETELEGEVIDEKFATQYKDKSKLGQSSQRKSLGRGASIKDGAKKSGYESPKEHRDTSKKLAKYQTKGTYNAHLKPGVRKVSEAMDSIAEKISASGYARAKKWREEQARKKDRDDNAKWEEKARTHKWDGKKWNKRDKPTHEKGTGPHARKAAEQNEGVVDAIKKGTKRHKDAVAKKKVANRKAVPYEALAAEYNPEGKSLSELATGILKNKPGTLGSAVMAGLNAGKKVPNKVKASEVAKNVKEPSQASVNEDQVDEAKVDAGKSPETKEKDRNVRKFGVSHNVAGHGKLRRALHRSNRGDKKIKGDKSQYVETESVNFDEATRLKKEKGYDKGGTKKPSGKPTAMSIVLDKIRKEHGHGAVIGQGGSRQQKKVKGAKSDAGTGKYKKAADAKKATASDAKKRGFKDVKSYVNTMARYGGKDNYDKGRGLGT